MHQFECGRMNRVAAEIAIEIGMFLQDGYRHASAREQIAGHHPRRSAANYHATRLQFFRRAHCN